MAKQNMFVFVVKQYAVREAENSGTQYARGRGVSPSEIKDSKFLYKVDLSVQPRLYKSISLYEIKMPHWLFFLLD